MATRIPTAIGRVLPSYTGEWDALIQYKKLDIVLRNGNSYIALVDNTGVDPITSAANGKWQMTAAKGDSGEISTVNASAYSSEEPQVAISTSGDPTAIDLTFSFGLPKGDKGDTAAFTSVISTANSVAWNEPAAARIDISGPPTAATISFDFDIPRAQGEGISLVDGFGATGSDGNVILTAVQYGRDQTVATTGHPAISSEQQAIARKNIGAQVAGDYQLAGNYIADPSASTGQFLRFNNEGNWIGESINLVPTGAVTDVGKYLRKTNSGMLWADVQSLPSAGAEGAPLVKYSNSDYDVTWGSFISTSEIDEIIEA